MIERPTLGGKTVIGGGQGYVHEEFAGWLSFDTWQYEEPASRLLPGEKPLTFSQPFINACIADPVDSLGTFAMGWEL